MQYLIKDLAGLTNLSKDRIRKWQERYSLLKPVRGKNGYYYHSNEDFFVLRSIKQKLESGQKLKDIIRLGRENLLDEQSNSFNMDELELISLISKNYFSSLSEIYDQKRAKTNFVEWVQNDLHRLVVLVGEAWAANLLSVADEYAFTRWFIGYFSEKIHCLKIDVVPKVLVSVYPKDRHELGAFLHYGLLLYYEISSKFCGSLPEAELLKELESQKYEELHISVVLNHKNSEIERFKQYMLDRFPNLMIKIGGLGILNEAVR